MDPLDHPPTARLDRCWDAPGGDLADHPAVGQDLPTRLVVVAGIQVRHRLAGQRASRADDPTNPTDPRRGVVADAR
jgi:hypothetical protein